MKNQAENYNYALPISEGQAVSDKTASFFADNVTVYDGTQAVSEDWKVEHPLPADTVTLAKAAQPSRNDHYKHMLGRLKNESGDNLFPNHKMFREYLRHQSHGAYFGAVEKDTSLNDWSVSQTEMRKLKVGHDQFIHLGKGKVGHYEALIEKPKDMPLKDFIENSELQFKLFTEGIGFTRSIGREKIRILTYGKPNSVKRWKDNFGRKWISTFWHITYNDMMYVTNCLPAPKGVSCLFTAEYNSSYNTGYEHFLNYNVLEQPMSYFGNLKEWKEFLALGDQYLPDNFDLKKMSYESGKKFAVEYDGVAIDIKLDEISDESKMTTYIGYSLVKPIGLEVHGLSLVVPEDDYEGIYLKKYYGPSQISPKNYQKQWKKITKQKNPYNNQTYEKDDTFYVRSPLVSKKRQLTNVDDTEIEERFVFSCFTESAVKSKKLKKICDKWKNGINL
jgi:hypothetical protein